jgi:hypothetical protein
MAWASGRSNTCRSSVEQQRPVCNRAKMIWNQQEAAIMRKQALLDCVDVMKQRCSLPWARTAALMTITSVKQNRSKFCQSQQDQVQLLLKFLNASKSSRVQVLMSVLARFVSRHVMAATSGVSAL